MIKIRKIARSLISYVPIAKNLLRKKGTSPLNGKYYYDIYLSQIRSLPFCAYKNKSGIIAEFGPGDALGVGFSALLDGFSYYYAFDIISHSEKQTNFKILKEIEQYFPNKKEILRKIEADLSEGKNNTFKYIVPWDSKTVIQENSVDLIISNAVMEHVLDIENTYLTMYKWLKPGGYSSHTIDYGSHEFSDTWNEHLYINSFFWKFLMHGRMYPINRYSHSHHVNTLQKIGFEIIQVQKTYGSKANFNKINKGLRKLYNEEDLSISSSRIIVRKPK